MIRFLMVRKEKRISGAEVETYYTIDGDLYELENALTSGGFSEFEYEFHQLLGTEILKSPDLDREQDQG